MENTVKNNTIKYCRNCLWGIDVTDGVGIKNTCPNCSSSLRFAEGNQDEIDVFIREKKIKMGKL